MKSDVCKENIWTYCIIKPFEQSGRSTFNHNISRDILYKDYNNKREMPVHVVLSSVSFLENIKDFSLIVDDKISNDLYKQTGKQLIKIKNANENKCKKLFTQIMKADRINVKKLLND